MNFKVVFCIAVSFLNISDCRKVVRWLESPRLTNWGSWGLIAICEENQWVSGINLKIEDAQGQRVFRNDDDTALNAVRLICTSLDGHNPDTIITNEGPWGYFRGEKYCPNGIATGFTLRSEPDQRGGDDTGAVDMALTCTNTDGSTTHLVGGGVLSYGHWTDQQVCPPRSAVCGLQTQREEPQGGGDDTSLNNVKVACCEIPNPFENCQNPELTWITKLHCHAGLSCSTDFKTGLSTTRESSSTVSESSQFYREIGFSVGAEATYGVLKGLLQFNAKFGYETVNGKSVQQIIRETSTYEQNVHINVQCVGALQELHIRCGILELKTSEYRCNPDNNWN